MPQYLYILNIKIMAREKKDLVVTSFNMDRLTKEEFLHNLWKEKKTPTEFFNEAAEKYNKAKRKENAKQI